MDPHGPDVKSQLAENFKNAILVKGYNPTKLAKVTNTHKNWWADRCNKKVHLKIVDILIISEATDIDAEWLIRRILGKPEPNYLGILNKLHSVLSAYDPRTR